MKSIKVALLGVIHPHADLWADAWIRDSRVEVIGFWDHDEQNAKEWRSKYNLPYYDNLNELLDMADAVGICSENNWHSELTIQSANKGVDVLCEKPMAIELDECDRMIEAVNKYQIRYMQAFPMRVDPSNVEIKRLLEEQVIGKISTVRKRHGIGWAVKDPIPSRLKWFTNESENGGGAFLDEGIHAADFLYWLFGRPISVQAVIDTVSTDINVDDNGVAIFRFENGVIATLQSSWTFQAGTVSTDIFGNEGTIIQEFTDSASTQIMGETSLPLKIYSNNEPEKGWWIPKLPINFKQTHEIVANTFVNCLLDNKPFPSTAENGRNALEMIIKATESAKKEKVVYFDEVKTDVKS